jgi:hypothetical protein
MTEAPRFGEGEAPEPLTERELLFQAVERWVIPTDEMRRSTRVETQNMNLRERLIFHNGVNVGLAHALREIGRDDASSAEKT